MNNNNQPTIATLDEETLAMNYQIALDNSKLDENGCRISIKSPGKAGARRGKPGTGYPQVPLYEKRPNHDQPTKRGTKRKLAIIYKNKVPQRVCLHVLAFYCKNRALPINGQIDISHLCHNRSCFRIEHLVREAHSDNWRRMGCAGGEKCPHEPKCILPHRM